MFRGAFFKLKIFILTMSEELRKEWRRAIWTLVTAAVLALVGTFVQSYTMQRSMSEQLNVLKQEQTVIRTKLDLIQIQIERKVDRSTLDNSLVRIDLKLEKIVDNIFKIQQKD